MFICQLVRSQHFGLRAVIYRKMDLVRVDLCLLLIIWFPRYCQSGGSGDHDDLLLEEHESGAVKKTVPKTWDVRTVEDLKNPGEVHLVNTWTNKQKGKYRLECFKNVKKGQTLYRVTIGFLYDSQPHLILDVTTCESEMLNSITIVPQSRKTSQLILLFEDKTCQVNISDFEENKLTRTTEPCPPKNQRGHQKSSEGYINSWKITED